jgi:hypothetical protein
MSLPLCRKEGRYGVHMSDIYLDFPAQQALRSANDSYGVSLYAYLRDINRFIAELRTMAEPCSVGNVPAEQLITAMVLRDRVSAALADYHIRVIDRELNPPRWVKACRAVRERTLRVYISLRSGMASSEPPSPWSWYPPPGTPPHTYPPVTAPAVTPYPVPSGTGWANHLPGPVQTPVPENQFHPAPSGPSTVDTGEMSLPGLGGPA